jgi:hypothetical protein
MTTTRKGRMKTKTKMKFHASCRAFPVLEETELAMLAEDIKTNGLIYKIKTLNGEIVDGRNRYLACERAGVEPQYEEITDKQTPKSFVNSMNALRRHLTVAQRAMWAAEMVDSVMGRQPKTSRSRDPHTTIGKAAGLLNVSTGSVKRAKVVKEKGTDQLKRAVKSGKVKLPRAATIARLPQTEQSAAIKQKPAKAKKSGGSIEEQIEALKERLVPGLRGLLETQIRAQILELESKMFAQREQAKNGVQTLPNPVLTAETEREADQEPDESASPSYEKAIRQTFADEIFAIIRGKTWPASARPTAEDACKRIQELV